MARKRWKLTGPGCLKDRKVHKGVIDLVFDPSPDGFISQSRKDKSRLTILIIPGDGEIAPIEIVASSQTWKMRLADACIPKDRLADLDGLVETNEDVQVVIHYERDDDLLDLAGSPKVAPEAVAGPLTSAASAVSEQRLPETAPIVIDVPFGGLPKSISCHIEITPESDGRFLGTVRLTIPHDEYNVTRGVNAICGESLSGCLSGLQMQIADWLDKPERDWFKVRAKVLAKVSQAINKHLEAIEP